MKEPGEDVRIVVEGHALVGTLIRPAPGTAAPHPALLFVHGWGGTEAQYVPRARRLAALGFVCVTFNLRGHATNEHQRETVSRAENFTDVIAVYDYLLAVEQVDPARVGVVGYSYGGYLAAILTTRRPVRWLSLRSPALYKDPDFDAPKRHLHRDPDLHAYRRRSIPPEENLALRSCMAFRGDALLVEAERDAVVPRPAHANYLAALGGARTLRHVVLPGADHALSEEPMQRAYTEALVGWFSTLVG